MNIFARYLWGLFVILILGAHPLSAEEISKYHTTITASQSGSLHIREEIHYDFGNVEKHGIFRDIPLTIKVDRYAKAIPVELSNIATTVDGLPVNYESRTTNSRSGGEMLRIKIGNQSNKISGEHLYTIEYNARRGVYPSALPHMESIRWNAVGSGSKIPVKQASADVILPQSLSRNNTRINVYAGAYGSTDSKARYNWVSDKHIRFETTDLSAHEAFTVEVNFPEGTLDQSASELKGTWIDQLAGSWHWAAIIGFFLFLWNYAKKFGVGEYTGSIAPQYYPPKGLSLLQSGLIIDKFADKKDFAAAVLELGSLGYLQIDNTDNKLPIIKKSDKHINDTELTADQKYIIEGVLFGGKKQYIVKSSNPETAQRMDDELNRINHTLYEWSVSSEQMRIDPQHSRSKFLMTAGLVALVLGIIAVVTTIKLFGADKTILVFMGTLFVGIGFFVLLSSIQKKAYSGIFFGLMWLAITSFGFGSIMIDLRDLPRVLASPIILIPAVAIGLWYFYKRVGVFTQKGLNTYRYLLGYKEFIKRTEKDRIKRFLKEDPLYLDKALPYAVLFGVSSHWLKLYEELNVIQPAWYYGDFHHIDDFNSTVQSQSVAPISESGGFSGGGSFSGGGGGGGGVGSW
jgi:uncharacterized membrane protein YgcG